MKNTKIIFTLLLSCIISTQILAQTLDEIVAKHIEAVGGKDNWAKVKTIKMEGLLKTQGMEINISTLQVDKVAMRQNITAMGMSGYSILTTTEGWNFMPFNGQTKPEPVTADDLKNGQDDLYIHDEFITYTELGKKIEYLGTEDIDGTQCFKIKMTNKYDRETTYFIDPDNYYTIKQISKVKANGQEMENATTFGNFKKLDEGIVFPMSITLGMGGMEIQKILINAEIPDSEFKIQN
jgi:hypothetical protein